jgi:hypothetical protein
MHEHTHTYTALSLKDVHPTAFHRDRRYIKRELPPTKLKMPYMRITNGEFSIDGRNYVMVTCLDGTKDTVLREMARGGPLYNHVMQSTGYLLSESGVRIIPAPVNFEGYNQVYLFLDLPWNDINASEFKNCYLRCQNFIQQDNALRLSRPIELGEDKHEEVQGVEMSESGMKTMSDIAEDVVKVPEEKEEPECPKKSQPETYTLAELATDYVNSTYDERVSEMVAVLLNIPSKEHLFFLGDGAGTGANAAVRLKRKYVSYDPSPAMVNLATSKKNDVKLGGVEELVKFPNSVVVISHVLTVAPHVIREIEDRSKVVIYEQKIFKGFSHFNKVQPNIYTRGVDWKGIVEVKPVKNYPVIPNYRSKDLSKPGVVVKFVTDRYFRVLEYLWREGIQIKVSTASIVKDELLLREVVGHYGHSFVIDGPNLVVSDGPYIGKEPFIDLITGMSSIEEPLYMVGSRKNYQFKVVYHVSAVHSRRVTGPIYVWVPGRTALSNTKNSRTATTIGGRLMCLGHGVHRINSSMCKMVIDVT